MVHVAVGGQRTVTPWQAFAEPQVRLRATVLDVQSYELSAQA